MKLTPEQRRQIFLRWLAGNRALAAGRVAESCADIGKSLGVARQTVFSVVKSLGGPGNNRPHNRRRARRKCLDCPAEAEKRDRCSRCYQRHRYQTEPAFRARHLADERRYKAARRSNEPSQSGSKSGQIGMPKGKAGVDALPRIGSVGCSEASA